MDKNQEHEARINEIQKELSGMPLHIYIKFARDVLQNMKQYHPLKFSEVVREKTKVDLPWPYSAFAAMHETAIKAYQNGKR